MVGPVAVAAGLFLFNTPLSPSALEAQASGLWGTPRPSVGEPRDPRVDALANGLLKPGDPGFAVIVIHEGRIIHQAGYGLADLASNLPNTPASQFHMASTGKQFTALGIMMLAEEGRLNYDDPIGQYLPELSRFGQGMTIRTLLHHTSGIPDYYDDSTGVRLLLEISPMPTNADALRLLETWGTPRPAGEEYQYSNTGYDVLGTLIERLSGQSLDEFLRQRVFEPLGMSGSWSMPNQERFDNPARSKGYDADGNRWDLDDYDPYDNLVGSGSVYSSVTDLFAYNQALSTDQLVAQTTWAEAYQPAKLNDGTVVPYGFGWDLGERAGLRYVGHSGAWEGYLSYILRFPAQQFSVYVLTNRSDLDTEKLAFQIFDLYREQL